jgi:hypothetical protein
MRETRPYGSGAARIAAIPVGESPTDRNRPVTVAVISSSEKGDRLVGSLEVKALVAGRNPGQIRPEGRATSLDAADDDIGNLECGVGAEG